MHVRRGALFPVSLALAVVAAGCAPAGLTRAGAPKPPITLDILVADAPGRFTDEVAAEFARAVATETGGDVEVALVRLEDDAPRWNQEVAQAVIEGSRAFGIVPAQSWDAFDVETFTALYVPFAVTTDELLDAIAQDPLADDMLAGLEPLGLTGLALIPGGVRNVFRTDEPLAGPDTYAGVGVRVAYSRAVWAYFHALGAHPDDPNGAAVDRMLSAGEITAVDGMFRMADSFIDRPAVTADTAAHPHALTLVANADALRDLPDPQRDAVLRAAHDTVVWAATERASTAEQAADLCRRAPGVVIDVAGDDVVDELRAAAQPVTDALLAIPEVAGLAARIETLGARVRHPTNAVVPCTGPPPFGAAAATPNVPEDFPEGIYRRQVSAEELREAGLDKTTVALHAGLWTLELREGRLIDDGCPDSTYAIVEERLVVTLGPEGDGCGAAAGAVLFRAGWRLEGDQLTFTGVESGHGSDVLVGAVFGGGPWTRLR